MAAKAAAQHLPTDVRLMQILARAFYALVVLVLLAAAGLWLGRQQWFEIRGIRLEGDLNHNDAASLRRTASAQLAGGFFTIDLARTRTLFETMPWVRRARVSRLWPNRIAVRLEEHRPAAYWSGPNGGDRLVNSHGEVFDANLGDVEDMRLPNFVGPEGSAGTMLALYQRLLPAVTVLQAEVDTLSLSSRGSWRLELDSGLVIEVGRGSEEELLERLRRFVRTLPQVSARYPRALQYVDLRHADGYAVRIQGVATTAPAAAARKN